ncbi:alkaline phosphatase family protein [Haloarcula sp. KBTZ06]|uniref:alkaline phosphatase family protein n=1 Tax=unclassified Haloarcula TaxID=2624677 RepID=UPI001248F5FA|nr:alkaline phosphatase family protein [Haloarcula sp. CBA1131]KAA9406598.1 nucleotide pyrophosphatase [Haloarcula sp. CBA1131]
MSQRQTVVIGLDGAHFELLRPWIEDGKLPNIASIIDDGTAADLCSVLPPVTSPNWKAYLTGKNPSKFGIFWWENIDTDNRRVYYPSHRKNEQTEYWERIAEDASVGVVNVPTTYPPKSVDNACVVAGAPDGENTGFSTPESLEAELVDKFDYTVTTKNRMETKPDATVDEILDRIDSRFKVAKHLLETRDLDFLQVTTFYINTLHHFLWDDETTLEAWRAIDAHIGDLRSGDRNVVLMSDHGSTEIETVFNINAWLEQEGFLTLKRDVSDFMYRLGLTTNRVEQFVDALGLRNLAFKLAPERLKRKVPDEQGEVHKGAKTDRVDWDESVALASGQGPVYLLLDPSTSEYDRVRSHIVEQLTAVRGPNGEKVCNDVLVKEEYYSGPYENEAPDIIIDQREGVHIRGGIGNDNIFADPENEGWRAENKRRGLFAACGPDFTSEAVDPMSILDLAPTLLHLYGKDIPTAMDGTVRSDVFAADSSITDTPIEYRDSDERDAEIRRIRRIARSLDDY